MVTAAKENPDVELAARVASAGGPDAVTFLRGTEIERAVWVATALLHGQWREPDRAGSGDDE